MSGSLRLFVGDCTATFEGNRERVQRGPVVVLLKPDDTLLVHDADGYQPVAWLTRADAVDVDRDGDAFTIEARAGDQTLRVASEAPADVRSYPVGAAGVPVGDCPDCGDALVRAGGDVLCVGCDERYGLPAGATVTDATCEACGLPRMCVDRGATFELCVDYACESLADAVADRFDREYDCPDCGSPLRVRSPDRRVFLGCDAYPDCETSFSLPAGRIDGECDCGLPTFETPSGRRCLDGTCEHAGAQAAEADRG